MALTWGPEYVDPLKRLEVLEYSVEKLPFGVSLIELGGSPVFGNAIFRDLFHLTGSFDDKIDFLELFASGRFSDWKQDPMVYFRRLQAAITAGNSLQTEIEVGNQVIAVQDTPLAPRYVLSSTQDVTERSHAQRHAVHLTFHDSLTGLPNRAAFTAELKRVIDTASESKMDGFSVLSIDLDHFKDINDVFGLGVGDFVLKEVASRLQQAAGRQFVGRLGSDEFVIICRGSSQLETAAALAGNVLALVAEEMLIEESPISVGLSIGIAVFPADGYDDASLLNHADAALDRSKVDGRGVVRFYQPEMDERIHEQRLLQQDLRQAVSRDELVLFYQPQATVRGTVTGFEALVRWNLPRLGQVMPGDFIPLAEKSGLIVDIGAWVLRQACLEAASWGKQLQISVNISPVQFRQEDLSSLIHGILLETGLNPERLEIEITEGVLVHGFERALLQLRRIKKLGVKVAMDDFGTGYSSLSYLQAFPFDKLKLDQSFIRQLAFNEQAREIIRAVIGLGRGLKLPVVAEGVETEEQIAFLRAEQCYGMQGYLIGRPNPIADYTNLVGLRNKVGPQLRRAAS